MNLGPSPFPTRMSLYLAKSTLVSMTMVLLALAASIILIDLVEQMRAIKELDGGNSAMALKFVFLRLPALLDKTLPFSVLIGCVVTFVGLSRQAEITAMRAAGFSGWQLFLPPAVVAAGLGIISILVLSPLGAQMAKKYEDEKFLRSMAVQSGGSQKADLVWKTLPMAQGLVLISGNEAPPQTLPDGSRIADERLVNVGAVILANQSSPNNSEREAGTVRLDAQYAQRNGADWILTNVRRNRIGVEQQFYDQLILRSTQSGDQDAQVSDDPSVLPIWELPNGANTARTRGGNVDRYWIRFHRLLSLPMVLASMALVAALLSTGHARAGSQARLIAVAIATGLSIQFGIEALSGIAGAGLSPPWAAVWMPSLAVFFIALGLVSLREDG